MADYRTTRIVPLALTLIIIAIVLAALASVARVVFFPSADTSTTKTNNVETALTSTTADRAVKLSVRGPIVADENYRTYQIQITPNKRILTVYKGYVPQQINNITLNNNIPSYEQFVYALNLAGLMSGTELTGASNDLRGICATGNLYQFQVLQSDKSLKMLWTTNCSSLRGSLTANLSTVLDLFFEQIPGSQSAIAEEL